MKNHDYWQKTWGGCCCGCKYRVQINKHPGNKKIGVGSITEVLGYGCNFNTGEILFMEDPHGHCEIYEPKNNFKHINKGCNEY